MYKYTHNNFKETTLGEFLDANLSIASYYKERVHEFLAIKFEDKTNLQRLESIYIGSDEIKENKNKPNVDKLLKVNTEFYIPYDKLNADVAPLIVPNLVPVSNLGAYIAPKLEELIQNPSYKATYLNGRGRYKTEFNDISVIIWSRALSELDQETGELKGGFMNITPFIGKLDTGVNKENGGNFNFSLAPIKGTYQDKWKVDKDSVYSYLSSDSNVLSYTQLTKGKTPVGERVDLFFERILQPNDLVFISFEKTDIEVRRNRVDINSNQLAKGTYDFIGMVDEVIPNFNFESNTIDLSVNGRDLIKTLIEDGCYFYPDAYGLQQQFIKNQDSESLIQRIFGTLTDYSAFTFRNIQSVLGFIINQLQSTGYVPDSVFSGWGEERNTKLLSNRRAVQKYENILKDLKDSCLVAVGLSRVESELNLSNESRENVEIEKTFNILITLIENEELSLQGGFLTQTALNSLNRTLFDTKVVSINTINEPNSATTAIGTVRSYINNKNKKPTTIIPGLSKGIWQIIDLLIEETVQNRLVVDSSITTSDGSLLNFVKKVVQEPFVEFFTDTYNNKFTFNVRKAPFDYNGYKSLIEDSINIENGVGVITPDMLLSENLKFNDDDVYTWFVLRPKGHLMGLDIPSLSYLPAIFIGEYVDIWGSRPLDVTTNYFPYFPKRDLNEAEKRFRFEKSIFQELKFIIDCNSYLPFSRKGTLTVTGDRRFKVGMSVYNQATDEYCQIINVAQSWTRTETLNERVTVLNVERCLRRKYFSDYFKVFNTVFDEKLIKKQNVNKEFVGFNEKIVQDWKINKQLMNFFLKRRQFT